MSARGIGAVPTHGTVVRLTAYFLKATGQVRGDEGAKRWRVVACACGLCACGRFAAVDEEIAAGEPRHIALGNLERVGAPLKAADQSDAPAPAWAHVPSVHEVAEAITQRKAEGRRTLTPDLVHSGPAALKRTASGRRGKRAAA